MNEPCELLLGHGIVCDWVDVGIVPVILVDRIHLVEYDPVVLATCCQGHDVFMVSFLNAVDNSTLDDSSPPAISWSEPLLDIYCR